MSVLLKTLGGLRLDDAALSRPKPLLLLAYLALEGPRDRRFLAELFWPEAKHRMNNLRVELARIRREAPGAIEADRLRAWVSPGLGCDAVQLLALLDQHRPKAAIDHYEGLFCDALHVRELGTELEEWLYATREFLAGRIRAALLRLAEEDASAGSFDQAGARAVQAYAPAGAAPLEPADLARMHNLMVAAMSPAAERVARDAANLGIELRASPAEARASLTRAWPPTERRRSSTIPLHTTPLVGRDLELADVGNLVCDAHRRLVTLLGSAGVGKTRLALQVARTQQELGAFTDGVAVVSLESLDAPDRLWGATAAAIEFQPRGSMDPLQQVILEVTDQRFLLVLDDFEHMMPAAGGLARLLRACPGITILVTSRERLNLAEEHVYQIDGLPFPAPDADLEEARRYDAVKLFSYRATRARPGYELTEEDLPHVLEICALVDGLPLGIELATAWLRALTCADIARELRDSLDLLTSRDRDAPDRHRSVRGAFEHSWARLDGVAREAFRKLAVFRGGFSREAASEVAGATIPTLAALVDGSLLRVAPNGRFDRHPLLYRFVCEKLAETPAMENLTRTDHAAYYVRLIESGARRMHHGATKQILDQLDLEFDNVRAAWNWAVEEGRVDMILASVDALEDRFVVRGRHVEGLQFFERAVSVLEDASSGLSGALGRLLAAQARLLQELGDYADAKRIAGRALRLLRAVGATSGEVRALDTLGRVAWQTGSYDAARDHWAEALRIARELGDPGTVANQLGNIALIEKVSGNYRSAETSYRKAIASSLEAGGSVHVVRNLNNLANLLVLRDRLDEAEEACNEALGTAFRIGFEEIVPYLLHTLSLIADELADHARVAAISEEVIQIARERGNKSLLSESLAMLGMAATSLGDHELAWRSFREALEVARAIDDPPATLTALSGVAQLLTSQERFTQAARLAALVVQHPATDQLAVRRVRSRAPLLREQLTEESWNAANEAGGRDRMEDVSMALLGRKHSAA